MVLFTNKEKQWIDFTKDLIDSKDYKAIFKLALEQQVDRVEFPYILIMAMGYLSKETFQVFCKDRTSRSMPYRIYLRMKGLDIDFYESPYYSDRDFSDPDLRYECISRIQGGLKDMLGEKIISDMLATSEYIKIPRN